jgi:hypothetical protein
MNIKKQKQRNGNLNPVLLGSRVIMEKEGGVDGRDLRGRMIGELGFWVVSRVMLRVGKGARGWESGIPR